MIINVLILVAAAVCVVRIICLAANLNPKKWPGQRLRHALFSLSVAVLAFGVVCAVGGSPIAGPALLISTAGMAAFDRRAPHAADRRQEARFEDRRDGD